MNRSGFCCANLFQILAVVPLGALALGACAAPSPALMQTGANATSGGAVASAAEVAEPPHPSDFAAPPTRRPAAPRPSPPVDLTPAIDAAGRGLDAALQAAGGRVAGWWKPLPAQPDYQTLLNPERTFKGSVSLGTVANGELLNAAKLQVEGDSYSVIERHRARGTQYATQAMLTLITDAAEQVLQASPGPKLRLGNMSGEGGGRIPWSRSHHSGRDADLAFFCKEKSTGKPVLAPDLLRFDPTGQSIERADLVFDTARNWLLVKALLTHSEVGIQWIFISNGLKGLLLSHARDLGEDPELIARAAKVLHQPTDAAPHDDHFHLRIACPMRDRLEGCLDYGPRWEWVDWHRQALQARSLALAKAFGAPDEQVRLKALDFLGRIRSPFAPALALTAARLDPSPAVRQRALQVATDIPAGSAAAIVEALRFVSEPHFSVEEKAYAYRVLRRSVDPLALKPLTERVADLSLPVAERQLAADAMIHYMNPELVPFLLAQLRTQPAAVSAQIAVTLRRITNRSEGFDWQAVPPQNEGAAADARAAALQRWEAWWQKNQAFSREAWVRRGFEGRGIARGDAPLDHSAVDALIDMLQRAPDYMAYNANLELKRITGRWAPLEAWDNARLHRYWARWWKWWRANHPDQIARLIR